MSNKENQIKLDIWERLFRQADADIIGISEHKLNIPKVPRKDKPSQLMNQWREGIIGRYSWLQNDEKGKYELGGTGLITSSVGTTHTIQEGQDDKRLGRWNWITIHGKKGKKTTVISVYRPEEGQQTLERQYARLCEKQQIKDGDTTLSIWESDLKELIKSFMNKNHEIIIGGDWNSNLNDKNGRVQTFLQTIGLRELVIERYGPGPNTHFRGTNTIDGIFATSGINIIRGGYTTFDCSPSDHRWVWIDISEKDLVGTQRDDRAPPLERRATTKIPSVKKAFQRLMERQIKMYNLYNRMDKLMREVDNTPNMTISQKQEYERIEERMQRAVAYADKRCRNIRRGCIPFSPTVTKLIGEIKILKIILLRQARINQPNRPHRRQIRRMVFKYKYKGKTKFDNIEQIKEQLKEAKAAYKHFKPAASDSRLRYLWALSEECAEEGDNGAEWHYQRLIRREQIKELFKKIKRAEGRGYKRGVDKVDIHTDKGKTTILDRKGIDNAIRDANVSKRLQAKHTPLRQEPLRTLVGEQMEYDKWEKILRKEVELPTEGVEEGTQLWYNYIQSYKDTPMDLRWTTEEYCESWAKMKEDKSCIPGIHTVHIKCLDPQSQAATIMSRLALIPLLTGYAPRRWKEGIDSMIPKKAEGELRPDKLRLILLMDARFNHNNKLIGKKLMEYGEKNGLLAEEQFGSRKKKSAIEHAINKRLTLDIARQHKAECIYIANDAKSCYDRILMMVTYLTMRNFGIPKEAALSSVETLAKMQMRIKTVYGVSEVAYGGDDWEDNPHGCGQGNGYGPAIWAAISSPLLKIMREKGFGTKITSPITKENLHMAAFSFVDDTDQIELNLEHHPWNRILKRAQESLTLWESLLRTTGGAIEPSKSDWTRLSYKWKNGQATVQPTITTDVINIRNSNGETQELKQTPATHARETLGVWQSADGNDKVQAKKLVSKIKKWGNQIAGTDMMRKEARTSGKVTIGRSLRYPLAATSIKPSDAKKVDSAFRKAALGKMGIVRTAATLPTGAPIELGGLAMGNNTEINQMIDHIDVCLQHGNTSSATGHLLRTSYESLAVEAGILGDPTSFKMSKISWVTANTWVGGTSESLEKHGFSMRSGHKGLSTWTNTDSQSLMELAEPYLSSTNACMFNKVRMHLKVVTVSDIQTADGRQIDPSVYLGTDTRSPSPSKCAYIWPKVPKPTKKEIALWQHTLGRIFQITETNLQLHSSKIFLWDTKTKDICQWNYDPVSGILYERNKKQWTQWTKPSQRQRRGEQIYRPHGTVFSIPSTVLPVTVSMPSPCKARILFTGKYTSLEEDEPLHETGWILRSVRSREQEEEQFAQNIEDHNGEICSDGSYKHNRSTSAFKVIGLPIEGSNTIPGLPRDHSSYRAELGGILAGITYTQQLCRKRNIKGTCTFYCDNKGALQAAFGWKRPNTRWSCYDLVSLIRFHLANSPIQWKWKHIHGHQDKAQKYDDLPPPVQANIDADKAAEEEMNLNLTPSDALLIGQSWQIIDEDSGRPLSGNLESTIRHKIYDNPMKEYWTNKLDISQTDLTTESWNIFQHHCQRSPPHHAIWMSKFNQRILGVKKNLYRRKHAHDEKCPLCNHTEDTDHVFKCPSKEADEAYQDNIDTLCNFLAITTSGNIGEAILEVCDCFRQCRRPVIQDHWEPTLVAALQTQLQLGARAFLGGFWTSDWCTLQERHYNSQRRNTSPKLWVCKAITAVQTLLKNIWLSRNRHMHHKDTCAERKRAHSQVNTQLDEVFQQKSQLSNRFLSHESVSFFRVTKDIIKKRTLRKKQRWVQDARAILQYVTALTPQQQRFRKYFIFRDSG